MHKNPLMTLLSALFHHQLRTLVKFLKRMIKSLKEVLKEEVTWPTEEEWPDILKKFNPLLPSSLEGCVAVVDGSEFKIQHLSKEHYQQKHFWVKKKQHLLNTWMLVPVTKTFGISLNSENNLKEKCMASWVMGVLLSKWMMLQFVVKFQRRSQKKPRQTQILCFHWKRKWIDFHLKLFHNNLNNLFWFE